MLLLLTLTTRPGEVPWTAWAEIDVRDRVWRIPGEHMEPGAEHRVPLGDTALEVLHQAHALEQPGQTPPNP